MNVKAQVVVITSLSQTAFHGLPQQYQEPLMITEKFKFNFYQSYVRRMRLLSSKMTFNWLKTWFKLNR